MSSTIADAIWPTVLLIGTSTIASIVLGIWIGIRAGMALGSRFDQGALGVTLVLYSMPEFWFGLLDDHAVLRHVQHLPFRWHGDPGVDAHRAGRTSRTS